jgi:hypothetical protein
MPIDLSTFNWGDASAEAVITAILKPYGLEGLARDMYVMHKDTGDSNLAYIWLREQPQYKEAFPGMEIRQKNNFTMIDEETYREWKTQYKTVMQNNGIPPGFYDGEDDFAQFIGKNISPQEIEERVLKGVAAAQTAPQEVKDALLTYYGIDEGKLAAYWLDPTAKGKDLLRQQAATYIGGAATRGEFAALSRTEAEELVDSGTNAEQALERFGSLSYGKELLEALPGDVMGAMSREQQLEYVKGTPSAQQDLAQRAAKRKAQFAGGGGFSEDQSGITGLADLA